MITLDEALANVAAYEEAYSNLFRDRAEVIVAGISDSFYQRPEEDDRVYTDPATMSWLLRADHILECMAKCGIHNTEEYEAAMKLHKETYE